MVRGKAINVTDRRETNDIAPEKWLRYGNWKGILQRETAPTKLQGHVTLPHTKNVEESKKTQVKLILIIYFSPIYPKYHFNMETT